MASCAAHGPSAFLFRLWKQKPWKELILAVFLGPSGLICILQARRRWGESRCDSK